MKFLLWALIGLAIVIWIWHGRQRSSGLPPSTGQGAGIAPDPDRIESMVRCASCGIHLPSSEAVTGESGLYFCCDEHRRGSAPG